MYNIAEKGQTGYVPQEWRSHKQLPILLHRSSDRPAEPLSKGYKSTILQLGKASAGLAVQHFRLQCHAVQPVAGPLRQQDIVPVAFIAQEAAVVLILAPRELFVRYPRREDGQTTSSAWRAVLCWPI